MSQENTQTTAAENTTASKPAIWNSDKFLSISAIFISLLSLLAISYQSYLAREENKLMKIQQSASVLPYLSTWFSEQDNEFQVFLGNKGVGPAFIKEVSVKFFDAEKQDTLFFDNTEIMFRAVRQKSAFFTSMALTTSTLRPNMLLQKNEFKKIAVFHLKTPEQFNLIRQEFGKLLISMKIVYEDVYGSQWYIDSSTDHPIKIEN